MGISSEAMTNGVRDAARSAQVEAWLDGLDPSTVTVQDPAELRRVGLAQRGVEAAEGELWAAVGAARAAGRTWTQIGLVLGVTRQSAQERFRSTGVNDPAGSGALVRGAPSRARRRRASA